MKFRTKLILWTSTSLLVGMALTASITLLGVYNLHQSASQEIEKGLLGANREYFLNYIQANARRTSTLLNQANSDVQTLADVAQTIEDNKANLQPLFEATGKLPFFNSSLVYNQAGGWLQNTSTGNSAVTIMPPQVKSNGTLNNPKLQTATQETAVLDLFVPAIKKNGLDKYQIYYSSSPSQPYDRLWPWQDYAAHMAKSAGDEKLGDVWDYEPFPTLLEAWEKAAASPGGFTSQTTLVQPYLDAALNEVVVSLYHPVWDKSRKKVQGLVGIDFTLGQLTKLIQDIKIADSGFAFLAEPSGNVLAVNSAGEQIMGLKLKTSDDMMDRKLQDSTVASLAKLKIPQDGKSIFTEIQIGGQAYILVMQPMDALNFLDDQNKAISARSWALGFLVPKEQLLGSLRTTQQAIDDKIRDILWFTLGAILLCLALVVVWIYAASGRMTASLKALTRGVIRLQQKDYNTSVEVKSKDEFGQLGQAFNSMALEIKNYTQNLEALVQQRTIQLETANQEINYLNQQLKTENLRMKAELEVTRQLQQMILPKEQELNQIHDLDIAGYMEPADEVGGDYYDVLQHNGRVKIGIGDVTGHGLESGVLMIMVQTAIRTLLANNEIDPSKYLSVVNRAIYDNVQRMSSDKNLTLSLLDYYDGHLRLSGQHEEMIVVRHQGQIEVIDTMDLGFPIGLEEDIADFVAFRDIYLDYGDVVVLYTDGIPEAENEHGEQYGLERLHRIIKSQHHCNAHEIQRALLNDLRDFIGTQRVFDDITLLVIKQREPGFINGAVPN